MEWRDEAIVLSVRRHGETSAIVTVMTRENGRHAGLVRGGQSRKRTGVLQPGNRVAGSWRARLESHLGTLTLEPVTGHAARLMTDPGRLAAMSAACALVDAGLPEREPQPQVFEDLAALMTALEDPGWAAVYARWEIGLLGHLGYGLDLSHCAATGTTDDLAYVSPRTGRAVSAAAGAPYDDRLLPLPGFLSVPGAAGRGADRAAVPAGEVARALEMSGHFLARHVFAPHDRPLPDARLRLAERLRRGRT